MAEASKQEFEQVPTEGTQAAETAATPQVGVLQSQGQSCAEDAASAFGAFVDTIAALRAPDGCPWDREQTHRSIARNFIEESYEAVDAIESDDMPHLREELGDVLLEVVLQAQIAQDEGFFTVADVCRDVDCKMVRRHPHIFGNEEATDSADVLNLWEQVKREEARAASTEEGPVGLLDSVPEGFPSLMQAQKISKKAVSAGFEWENLDAVWQQVDSEVAELNEAFAAAPKDSRGRVVEGSPGATAVELEFGDVLFSLVNVARKMGIDAESALRATCGKFRSRWSQMERAAWEEGRHIEDLSFDELQRSWDAAKGREL
jgi:tetrapyrrole methylase family protein/MazG family protein